MQAKHDSFMEYLSSSALGSSRVKKAKISGKHFKEQQDGDSSAFQQGRAIHCAVLEPDQFESRFTFWDRADLPHPEKDLKTKANKDAKQEWQEEADRQGLELLEKSDWGMCISVRESLANNYPEIYQVIRESAIEKSFYAEDPATGLALKARPDALYEERGLMIDLKTTRGSAKPSAFAMDAARYDYPLQAAFHSKVVELCAATPITDYYYIVVEKSQPYGASVVRMSDEDRQRCKIEVDWLLSYVKEWEDSGYYPGYEAEGDELGVKELVLPMWYRIND